MDNKEILQLRLYNEKRLEKYNLLKKFENKHLGKEFKLALDEGYSSENPKFKYLDYLKYYFLPFVFINKILRNDLNLLAVQKNEIGLIYYSIYITISDIEEVEPREIIHSFLKSVVCLEKISENPKEDILEFLDKNILKKSQTDFIIEIFNNYENHYIGFKGSYQFIEEPHFHFKYVDF